MRRTAAFGVPFFPLNSGDVARRAENRGGSAGSPNGQGENGVSNGQGENGVSASPMAFGASYAYAHPQPHTYHAEAHPQPHTYHAEAHPQPRTYHAEAHSRGQAGNASGALAPIYSLEYLRTRTLGLSDRTLDFNELQRRKEMCTDARGVFHFNVFTSVKEFVDASTSRNPKHLVQYHFLVKCFTACLLWSEQDVMAEFLQAEWDHARTKFKPKVVFPEDMDMLVEYLNVSCKKKSNGDYITRLGRWHSVLRIALTKLPAMINQLAGVETTKSQLENMILGAPWKTNSLRIFVFLLDTFDPAVSGDEEERKQIWDEILEANTNTSKIMKVIKSREWNWDSFKERYSDAELSKLYPAEEDSILPVKFNIMKEADESRKAFLWKWWSWKLLLWEIKRNQKIDESGRSNGNSGDDGNGDDLNEDDEEGVDSNEKEDDSNQKKRNRDEQEEQGNDDDDDDDEEDSVGDGVGGGDDMKYVSEQVESLVNFCQEEVGYKLVSCVVDKKRVKIELVAVHDDE